MEHGQANAGQAVEHHQRDPSLAEESIVSMTLLLVLGSAAKQLRANSPSHYAMLDSVWMLLTAANRLRFAGGGTEYSLSKQ